MKMKKLKHIVLLSLRPSTASSAIRLRNKCVYGCSHSAISNRVITITNNNSLWNSCPLFCTIQTNRVNAALHWTVPFPLLLFLISFPRWASTDPINPQQVQSVLPCFIVCGQKGLDCVQWKRLGTLLWWWRGFTYSLWMTERSKVAIDMLTCRSSDTHLHIYMETRFAYFNCVIQHIDMSHIIS